MAESGEASGYQRIPAKRDDVKGEAKVAAGETKGESSAADVVDAGTKA